MPRISPPISPGARAATPGRGGTIWSPRSRRWRPASGSLDGSRIRAAAAGVAVSDLIGVGTLTRRGTQTDLDDYLIQLDGGNTSAPDKLTLPPSFVKQLFDLYTDAEARGLERGGPLLF